MPEEDQHDLGDVPHRHVEGRGLQAQPRRQQLQIEVPEDRVGDDLEDGVDGHEDGSGLPVAAGQVVPDEDHRDAAGQADDDQAGPELGLVRQEDPGQGEHQRGADDPVQEQGRWPAGSDRR